ncbi:cysteine hydrolase family protein [Roseovarius aquimarinus]|uniref:Cysteine hydrolase family protein n=1 Tax=Roseovarius aquimarinus TaxID=1229156 RepID=A0ABW7I6X7_9RHOB
MTRTYPSQFTAQDREREIVPARTALLSIDMQNAEWSPEAIAEARKPGSPTAGHLEFMTRIEEVLLPAQARLQDAARAAGIEVIFTTIEALTQDGRDISLDHKMSNLFFPKGSWEAKVIDAVGPKGDEIVIPKTSSGIFNSTNFDYVLRNLGIEYLIMYGVCTDQCVEGSIRDAADRGYYVTQIEDCCATYSMRNHENSIRAMDGHFARLRSTDQMIDEIARLTK